METRQLSRLLVDIPLEDVQDCLVYDRHGVSVPFKELYQDRKAVIIFVRVGANESLLMFELFVFIHTAAIFDLAVLYHLTKCHSMR